MRVHGVRWGHKMKPAWLSIGAAAVAVAATSAAFGADLPVGNGFAVPPPYNWNGFYMGANFGAGLASGSLTDNAMGSRFSGNNSGIIGGGTIGYNWQFAPNWVLGGEGTFDGSSISKLTGQKDSSSSNIGPSSGPTITTLPTTPPITQSVSTTSIITNDSLVQGRVNTNWASTIAARIGYTQSAWLLYGKVGVGWASSAASATWVNTQTTNTTTVTMLLTVGPPPQTATTTTQQVMRQVLGAGTASSSNITPGVLVGIGAEYALSYNWTIKGEYNYLGLSRWSATGANESISVNRQLNTFTIGMNYKFFN